METEKTEIGLKRLLENTPEAYYWAGFLMADGNFDTHGYANRLTLFLSKLDKKHVIRFSKYIDVKNLEERKAKNIIGPRGDEIHINKQFGVRKQDSFNVPIIMKKFDYKVAKSYNPPSDLEIKNNDLFTAFFIGYLDGDGTIGTNNRLQVTCHTSWEKVLNSWFLRIWNLSKCEILNNVLVLPKSKIYKNKLVIGTSNYTFLKYLLEKIKELDLPVLNRKWKRIKNKLHNHTKGYENKIKIIELFKQNKTTKEICKEMDFSRVYVCKAISRYKKGITLKEAICQKN